MTAGFNDVLEAFDQMEESEQRALSATLFQRVLRRDFPGYDDETLALLAEDVLRELDEHASHADIDATV